MQWTLTPYPELLARRNGGDRADVYGVIFHDARHPFVRKVLEDKIYWEALDNISGSKWTIYAYKVQGDRGREELNLVREALNRFGLDKHYPDLPVIAIFAESQRTGDLHRCVQRIDGNSESSVFNSIVETLGTATEVIHKIDNHNLRNTEEIFQLIEGEFRNQREIEILFGILKRAPGLRDLFQFATGGP